MRFGCLFARNLSRRLQRRCFYRRGNLHGERSGNDGEALGRELVRVPTAMLQHAQGHGVPSPDAEVARFLQPSVVHQVQLGVDEGTRRRCGVDGEVELRVVLVLIRVSAVVEVAAFEGG